MQKSKHLVLIHGNFVNNLTWNEWKAYFEQKGFIVHCPSNSGHEGIPSELRKKVHPDLASTGIEEVVKNLENFIDGLPEKPWIVGHSLGGLAVLKLIESGKALAGVSIHGAPPKNVTPPPFQTLKTVFPSLGLFSRKKTWMGSRKWFNKAFFNTLPEAEQAQAYERFTVPESTKLNLSVLKSPYAHIDFKKPHAPLLFLGGSADNIFPPSFTAKIAGKYKDPQSKVDLKIFEGRSHFTCGEAQWQDVAEYIHQWYESL